MARYSVDPTMPSPDYQWSIDDLRQMEEIGKEIDAIEAKIEQLDQEYSGADNAGAWEQCSRIETEVEILTEVLTELRLQYDLIGYDDYRD